MSAAGGRPAPLARIRLRGFSRPALSACRRPRFFTRCPPQRSARAQRNNLANNQLNYPVPRKYLSDRLYGGAAVDNLGDPEFGHPLGDGPASDGKPANPALTPRPVVQRAADAQPLKVASDDPEL